MVLADDACLEAVRAVLPRGIQVVLLQEWAAQARRCFAAAPGEPLGEGMLAAAEVIAVVVGEDTSSDAVALVQRCDSSVPVVRLAPSDGGAPVAFLASVAERLAALLARARLLASSAKRSLGLLRRDYDRLQGSFAEVEEFLYTLGGPKLSLCVEYPPTAETIVLSSGPPKAAAEMSGIVIRLPTYASGLIAAEVWVREIHGRGSLKVAVEDLAGTVLAEGEVEVDGARQRASLLIPFRRSATRLFRDCRLRLRAVASGGDGLKVSMALSSPHPQPAFCASVDAGRVLAAPLALRVWRGLPDTTPPPALQPPSTGSAFFRPGQLARPRLLVCDDPHIGFEVCSYWQKEDAILVHPPARGMTIVLVPGVTAPFGKVSRVAALAHNAHREGPPLRFALAAVPGGFGDRVNARALLTNWISLPPLAWGEVHAVLERPLLAEFDLILGTITAQGEVNHWAWGLFRGFMVFP